MLDQLLADPTGQFSDDRIESDDSRELDEIARDLNLGNLSSLKLETTFALRKLAQSREHYPNPGDRLLDFDLLREIGRGSFARVYLARQAQLANRPVVLKISAQLDEEPQTLAQMQHANIVPIYSVHRSDPLQIVCMPFFGSVTLANVMNDLGKGGDPIPTTGRQLLDLLFRRAADRPADETVAFTPSRTNLERLGNMPFIPVALWIGARIADGLHHAHERSILHCDLKPENVLMSDDGQPMLLDFNVSVDVKVPLELRAARIGGTLPYMAPERLEQIRNPDRPVDARIDLYALGVILYRLLTGFPPYDSVPGTGLNLIDAVTRQRGVPPIPPRRLNPAISPAVDAIVRKLLEPDPSRRYARAAHVVEDIERQLSDRPLKYASDPSIVERARKWRRRNPRLATAVGVVALVGLLLVLPSTLAAAAFRQQAARQREFERDAAVLRQHDALDEARTAVVLLSTRTGDRELLDDGLQRGAKTLGAYEIATDDDWLSRPAIRLLSAEKQTELRQNFGELLMLMARGEQLRANGAIDGVRQALQWNRLALDCFPPSERPRWIARQRRELAAKLPGEERADLPAESDSPPTELDRYFDALELASQGRHEQALELLAPYTERHPRHFVAWFVRGMSHEGHGQFADAAAAFTICISLSPDFPWAHLNRGIVRLKQRQPARAERDFTRALELKKNWTLALWNRAVAWEASGELRAAEDDLSAALGASEAPVGLYFLRAKVRKSLGNAAGAESDRAEGMKRTPGDAVSWNTRGLWRLDRDAPAALNDFNEALRMNPRLREAMQNKALVLADHLDRPADAVAALDGLLAMYPTHLDARAGRGVYLARLGETERAVEDAALCLGQSQHSFLLYQMAGLYAQLSRSDASGKMRAEALKLAARAFASGFDQLGLIDSDPDIVPIRQDPAFKRLREHAQALQAARRVAAR